MKQLRPRVTIDGATNQRIQQSDDAHLFLLVANTEVTIEVPTDSNTVALFATVPVFWMGRGETQITVPVATQSPTDLEINPAIRDVDPGQTLRFISESAGWLEVAFYV